MPNVRLGARIFLNARLNARRSHVRLARWCCEHETPLRAQNSRCAASHTCPAGSNSAVSIVCDRQPNPQMARAP